MLNQDHIGELATAMRGRIVQPGDPDYDASRRVYNAMIDRRPALIARCANAGDVIAAVNSARTHRLLAAIRGGGPNGPCLGTRDDGPGSHLAPIKGVRVAPAHRPARPPRGRPSLRVRPEPSAAALSTQ